MAAPGTTTRLVGEVLRDDGTGPLPPVLGRVERLSLLNAATANGAAVWLGLGPGDGPDATVAAAVLSLGWTEDISGERALRAYALGCEIQTRLAGALPSGEDHHFTRFGPAGPVASAVAAGKGAANGVHAALLAKDGLTAPVEVLEHPRGFFAVLGLGLGDDRADGLADGLGAEWRWLEDDHGTDRLADTVQATVEAVLPGRSPAFVAAVEELADAPSIRSLVAAASRAEVAA